MNKDQAGQPLTYWGGLTNPALKRPFKTYSVDGVLPNLHEVYDIDEIPVKDFSGKFIDLSDYEIVGYVAGMHVAKSPKLTFDVFRFVHIAGEYTHIKKFGKVTVMLAKQTKNGRVTTLICKRK